MSTTLDSAASFNLPLYQTLLEEDPHADDIFGTRI